ncbi:flagellar biosynthesis protein FlhB [Sodalis endosymbiont of Spalangia cameroni]|uniref:flagellar biosynthesis protein FlhB n=1 Tax=Sodalis praecaptivus TaxID=1239307 RepID=UPI0031F73C06
MAEESDLEKSEAPTPHRLQKARKEGQVPRSKELVSWLMLLSGWSLLWLAGDHLARGMGRMLQSGLSFDLHINGEGSWLLAQFSGLVRQALLASAPLFLGVTLVAAGSPMLIGGVLFSSKAVSLDLKRLNPFSGLKRLFSMQMMAELTKTLFKVCLVGGACGTALWFVWPRMTQLAQGAPLTVMAESLSLIRQCVLLIILALLPVVGFDILYQLFSHLKKLRMSRHDIREEYKEQEGDPQLKSLIRQRQRQQAQRRMMQDVANADVVIVNPTHYAVALKYEQLRMTAPRLVAKGAGVVALNIRQRAEQQGIPILEAPPLARALYRHCEIGGVIPVALYGAVAEVLAWVYGLRRWRKQGGLRPRQPSKLTVPKALNCAKGSIFNGKPGS